MPISHGHTPYKYSEFVAPIEANDLIKAVEVKQNLYDAGTAAIDAKMESLAGFDILREQDRSYVNQELKKIYQVMQQNASKDFSNTQVVRSFLDVTKPLENDVIFKNAKDSTAEYRNRQATLKEIRDKKPELYSAANEWNYLKDTDDWMNDPNPGASLGHKEYVPYKDLSKKVMDIVSKMKPDSQLTMANVGDWLATTQWKGLEDEKIKNAVLSQLSADEINQLRIDAGFDGYNTDPRTKFNTVVTSLQEQITRNEQYSKIVGIENKTGYTQEQHAMMAKAAAEEMQAANDPKALDDLYTNAYISNFVDGIGKAYSYRDISQTLKQDPYAFMHKQAATEFAYFQKQEKIKQQDKIDLMLLTGEAMKNEKGEIVNNPNYKPKKSKEEEEEENFIFSREATAAGNIVPDVGKDSEEEQIINGTLPGEKQVTQSSLNPFFKSKLDNALRYIVGDEVYDDDYDKNDYEVRFEPVIVNGVKTTKVTIVDSDWGGAKDNISFTIDEAIKYSDFYEGTDPNTPEDKQKFYNSSK